LLQMPYFDEIPRLVAGTALEELYEWSFGGAGGQSLRPAAVRVRSLRTTELDLPAPVLCADLTRMSRMEGEACGAAAATAAAPQPPPLAPPLPISSPEPFESPGVTDAAAALGEQRNNVSSAAAAAAECSVADPHDEYDEQQAGFRARRCNEAEEAVEGPADAFLAASVAPDDRDPRVSSVSSLRAPSTMARPGSMPFLAVREFSPGAQEPQGVLRRTNTVVGGQTPHGSQAAPGGGGPRLKRAGTAGRVGVASLRSFFAALNPSSLSISTGLQSDVVTAEQVRAADGGLPSAGRASGLRPLVGVYQRSASARASAGSCAARHAPVRTAMSLQKTPNPP
jgi:hypothetical protein